MAKRINATLMPSEVLHAYDDYFRLENPSISFGDIDVESDVEDNAPEDIEEEKNDHNESDDMHVTCKEKPMPEIDEADSLDIVEDRELREIPCAKIRTHPDNPFDVDINSEEYKALARSIEVNGILEFIIVMLDGDGYLLLSGERRLQIWKDRGHTLIHAWVRKCSPEEGKRIMLDSNMHRIKLSKAEVFRAVMIELELKDEKREEDITRELSARYSLSRRQIQRYKRINRKLPPCYFEQIGTKLSFNTAYYITQYGFDERTLQTLYGCIKDSKYTIEPEDIDNLIVTKFSRDTEKKHVKRNRKKRHTVTFSEEEVHDIIGDIDVTRGVLKAKIMERFKNGKF